ncbi:translesion error-prone DNA polymerase V autoproteolytic subunit [Pantoea agglomerans]|uniref:translesion error-prone DNA polymerase V autoproteolytic subunit n=1 Tax=Enterobacter agglomerans TaxID=549 RepID=UPI001654B27D|nr:translesion error-prone DNA polymerase V autoproteolytic subunit [Pantoea agglomerans]
MLHFYPLNEAPLTLTAPLYLEPCQAGFPSPAADYVERELDLNEYCIRHPSATFFVRASGHSMSDIGLRDGALMIVDRAETPGHGDIVIAEIEGEFTVKQLLISCREPRVTLQPMNPSYAPIYPDPNVLQIFGVVTFFVHKTRDA